MSIGVVISGRACEVTKKSCRSRSSRRCVRMVGRTQGLGEPFEIAAEPSHPHARAITVRRLKSFADRPAVDEHRKIDAGTDRELDRGRQPRIYLHEHSAPRGIAAELDLRVTIEPDRIDQRPRSCPEIGRHGMLADHRAAAKHRQRPMGNLRKLSYPATARGEDAHGLPPPRDPFLHQRNTTIVHDLADRLSSLPATQNRVTTHPAPCPSRAVHPGTRRLDHCRQADLLDGRVCPTRSGHDNRTRASDCSIRRNFERARLIERELESATGCERDRRASLDLGRRATRASIDPSCAGNTTRVGCASSNSRSPSTNASGRVGSASRAVATHQRDQNAAGARTVVHSAAPTRSPARPSDLTVASDCRSHASRMSASSDDDLGARMNRRALHREVPPGNSTTFPQYCRANTWARGLAPAAFL